MSITHTNINIHFIILENTSKLQLYEMGLHIYKDNYHYINNNALAI